MCVPDYVRHSPIRACPRLLPQLLDFPGQQGTFIGINVPIGTGGHDHRLKDFQTPALLICALQLIQRLTLLCCGRLPLGLAAGLVILVGLPGQHTDTGQPQDWVSQSPFQISTWVGVSVCLGKLKQERLGAVA